MSGARTRGRGPGRQRGRGVAALVVPAVAALAVIGLVIGGLMWVDSRREASGRCYATLPDGTVERLDVDQAANAALFAAVSEHRALPARATTIAIATALQESKMRNIDYGDRDSVGLFQQRPSQGWGTVEQIMDPVYATDAFYDVLVKVNDWESAEITDAAQDVQRSAFPTAYAQHETRARAFASSLTGHSPAQLTCQLRGTTVLPDGTELGDESDAAATTARLGAISARLTRDYVDIAHEVADGGFVVVDATSLPLGGAEPGRAGWAVAHWAVATAADTGARAVVVDGQAWVRADGGDADWRHVPEAALPAAQAAAAANLPAGTVLIA